MRWKPAITFGGLVLAIAALAAWQADEYGHECELAWQSVSGAAESVMSALVGGVRSHRRMGLFFSDNIQGVLEGLVRSSDVRAAAIVSSDATAVLAAGEERLLQLQSPPASGEYWDEEGFRLVVEFHLPLDSGETGEGRGAVAGGDGPHGPPGGPGGPGGGRGRGWRRAQDDQQPVGAFGRGQKVFAVLVLDRGKADLACRRSAWLRFVIVGAGSLMAACIALAWSATLRLAEARARERSLAGEARHLRELSQAAAGLAHETRNPLGLIRGWTQRLAETDGLSSEGRRRAQAVVEECDRVTARINQFLAYARPSEPRTERFDVGELVEQVAALLEPDFAARRVAFRLSRGESTVEADREMVRQALFNLLQNAVQASPEGESVEATVSRQRDGTTRIEVADRGPGVPDTLAGKLFTPYFTTRPGGTGLGLAIVRRIAAAHGWTAGYAPRPGGGAVFFLSEIHG